MCIPCILIPVLVGLISALLGYLLGKLLGKNDDELNSLRGEIGSLKKDKDSHLSMSKSLTSDVDGWKSKYALLETELNACKSKLSSSTSNDVSDKSKITALQAELDACKANTASLNAIIASFKSEVSSLKMSASLPALIPFDAELAKTVFGKKITQDDLKLVEGIGPKIEELYHAAGIKTWKALSETPVEKSKEILDAAGERYQIHNPGTWAKQAALMYQGKWQELKEWQDKLDGGKE